MSNGKGNVPASNKPASNPDKTNKVNIKAIVPILPTDKTISAFSSEGPAILNTYFEGDILEEKAASLEKQGKSRKSDAAHRTSADMVRIFQAEPRARDIAMASMTGGKVEMPKALEYFKAAFGYVRVFKSATGETTTEPTDLWNKRFHVAKNASPEDVTKATERRNNFSTFLKLCMQRAIGISDLKEIDEVSFDETSKTVLLAGPGAEKVFGASEVTLNKRDGKDAPEVEGKQVASLEALRKAAIEKYGKPGKAVGGKGKEEGNASDTSIKATIASDGDVQKATQQAANIAIAFINRLEGNADEPTRKILTNLYHACEPFVDKLIAKGTSAHDKVTLGTMARAQETMDQAGSVQPKKTGKAGTRKVA